MDDMPLAHPIAPTGLRQTLNILSVNTSDGNGGAEKIASGLCRAYSEFGHRPRLAVGRQFHATEDRVRVIPNEESRSAWTKACIELARQLDGKPSAGRIRRRLAGVVRNGAARPARAVRDRLGHEDFDYPGTKRLLELPGTLPDVLHLHNLHGGYFDLRELPTLSNRVPTFVTLHDAWLLSGHCAHSLDCDHWRTGCGRCPDLERYPRLLRDGTAFNWRRKRDIYRRSRLHVAAPSQWLLDRAKQSILREGAVDFRVIPNGVDTRVFRPGDKAEARRALDLELDVPVVLFAANTLRKNPYKDYETFVRAVQSTGRGMRRVRFLALGEAGEQERHGNAVIEFIPYINNDDLLARHYQAADLYVHVARADTFPNSILEALASGTPVIATSVGGIPEQIAPLSHDVLEPFSTEAPSHEWAGLPDGLLVPAGDAEGLAAAILRLLDPAHRDELERMGANARKKAESCFDIRLCAKRYLDWFQEALGPPAGAAHVGDGTGP